MCLPPPHGVDPGATETELALDGQPVGVARTEREVALFGHSFGGATVAACLLRDGTPRVVGGVNTIYSNGTGSRSSSSPADVQSSEPLRPAARFSHGFLFDPWIGGFACPLAEAQLRARKLT